MSKKVKCNSLNPDNIVQKSRPLLLATDINYTAGQLKVLDTYISCINSRDPDNTVVDFKQSEYEELLGVSRLRIDELQKSLSDLIKLQVTVPFKESREGLLVCNLFDGAAVNKDSDTGEWIIHLKCSETAKPLFFNLEQIGYVRYQLRNTTVMKSMYSIYLYQYLKDNAFRRTWNISVDTFIKDILHVKNSRYRKDFWRFRDRVLNPSIDEVNVKTDIRVTFNTLTAHGRIDSIDFTVYDFEKEQREIEQLSIDFLDGWQPL